MTHYTSHAKIHCHQANMLAVRAFSDLHQSIVVTMETNDLSPFLQPPSTLPPSLVPINSGEEGCENSPYFPGEMWLKSKSLEHFLLFSTVMWLPWKPMAYLTLPGGPPLSHQVWSPSVHKHGRRTLPKFPLLSW